MTTTRSVPNLSILHPYRVPRGGGTITLGICPCCGRILRQARANKTGARCDYDGAQFDADGRFIGANLL